MTRAPQSGEPQLGAPRIVVAGAASGLGRAAQKALGGISFVRGDSADALRRAATSPYDAILHCAFASARPPASADPDRYVDQSVHLTGQLTQVPHRKFVFVSTIDVYPRDGARHDEGEEVDHAAVDDLYARAKLACETVVRERCPNHLILRAAAMLGPDMRSNNLVRMVREPDAALTLAAGSRLNTILHRDVIDFVRVALGRDETGIFNLASADSVTLAQIAAMFGLAPRYGTFTYTAADVDTRKAAALLPAFRRKSADVVAEFFQSAPAP